MLFGFLALLFGQLTGSTVVPIATKLGMQYSLPISFLTLRFLAATILFSPLFIFSKKIKLRFSDYKKLALLSGFLFINVGFFTVCIKFTTVIMSQIFYTLTPI